MQLARSWLLVAGLALSGAALAQSSGSDHGAHHPGVATPGIPDPPVRAAPSSPATPPRQPMAMHEMMGRSASTPLYPGLMNLTPVSPEARSTIEAQARFRAGGGTQAIRAAMTELERALALGDPAHIAAVAAAMKDGLREVESGAAVLEALAAGREPREIALRWFKGQLGIIPGGHPAEAPSGPFGWSWAHVVAMTAMAGSLVLLLALSGARLRRASALAHRMAAPARDMSPDAPAAASAPEPAPAIPSAPLRAGAWTGQLRVVETFQETPTVRTFRLMSPDGGPVPFLFLPGQFVILTAEIEGSKAKRSYTIASSPTERDYVELTIKREESGIFSRYLHDRLRVGSLVDASAPHGVFTFTGNEADSIVLIGGGVGITPLMSVLRYLTDRAWPGEIYLLFCARSTEDFIFRDELEYRQRRHRNLHVSATMTRAERTVWMGSQGRLTKAFIAEAVPEIARQRVHVCGPPPMMEAAQGFLAELGVPPAQVKTEAFGPAKGTPPALTGEPARPGAGVAVPTVSFTLSGKAAPLPPTSTVLEAAESVGVEIEYACRVGTCGTCMVPLIKGSVTMAVEDGLPAEEKARGKILACQAKSTVDLAVAA